MTSIPPESVLSVVGVTYPFDLATLKQTYFLKAQKVHPDHGGSADEFKKLNAAYEYLILFARSSAGSLEELRTTTGLPLSELGRGYPNTVNSVKCKPCGGRGYTREKSFNVIDQGEACPACSGSGTTLYKGWFYITRKVCQRCQGRGFFNTKHEERYRYFICSECNGIGEVVLLNPVLKKGVVTTSQKQKRGEKKKAYCECGARLAAGKTKCWKCGKEAKAA